MTLRKQDGGVCVAIQLKTNSGFGREILVRSQGATGVLVKTLARPGEHVDTNPPAVAFSSLIDICVLGLSWRAAGQVLAAPRAISGWLIGVGVMLFIVLSALYAIKTVRQRLTKTINGMGPIRIGQ
jgi:hypothetical protein